MVSSLGMEFNSIISRPFTPRLMTKEERTIIIETLVKFKDDRFNILAILESLKESGDIDADSYKRAVRHYICLTSNQKADQLGLIFASLYQLTFDKAVAILKDIGCDRIVRVLIHERFKRFIGHVNRVRVANTEATFSYYQRVKMYIDNHVFKSPATGLQRLIDMNTEITLNETITTCKRQRAADKVVALYALLLSLHRTREDRLAILDKMKTSMPRVLDTTSVELVYHSKRAITEAIAGNDGGAMEQLRIARTLSNDVDTCFASILSAHDHQYVYVETYMKSHREDDLGAILRLGDNLMGCVLGEGDEDIQNQWKRIALLYQAFSLLNVTALFKVQVNESVTMQEHDINRIKRILKEFRRVSTNVEIRREMIYSICMARCKDLEGDLDGALAYQEDAVRLADEGGVFFPIEKTNIEEYRAVLKDNQMISLGSTEPSSGLTENRTSLGNTEPDTSLGGTEPI